MKRHQYIIAGVLLLAAVLSFAFPNIPSPPQWLVNWTSWLLTAISIVIAIAVGSAAKRYLGW